MNNVNKLPDSYAKGKSSNNYKLLNINEQAIADAKVDAQAVVDMLDMQQATGRTLELYGEMVGQKRGALNDIQYRYMILTRIGINVVQGNYETVIDAVKNMFGCGAEQIVIRDSEKPCRVRLETFPLELLVSAGFSSKQAIAMIESILPIGVRVDDANFEGTFEFAETEGEYDEAAGFADVEQTIGGYFGLLQGEDENSPILPL